MFFNNGRTTVNFSDLKGKGVLIVHSGAVGGIGLNAGSEEPVTSLQWNGENNVAWQLVIPD
jgi:hypothetical protein